MARRPRRATPDRGRVPPPAAYSRTRSNIYGVASAVHGAVLHAFFYHPEYNAVTTAEWRSAARPRG